MIAAGLDGIERDLDPGEPHNQNLYALSPKSSRPPASVSCPRTSTRPCWRSRTTPCCAGPRPGRPEFLRLKHMGGWSMRHVSDWEIKNYLEFF